MTSAQVSSQWAGQATNHFPKLIVIALVTLAYSTRSEDGGKDPLQQTISRAALSNSTESTPGRPTTLSYTHRPHFGLKLVCNCSAAQNNFPKNKFCMHNFKNVLEHIQKPCHELGGGLRVDQAVTGIVQGVTGRQCYGQARTTIYCKENTLRKERESKCYKMEFLRQLRCPGSRFEGPISLTTP
jgi:hypothetical protein